MLPVVFLVTLGLVATGLVLENTESEIEVAEACPSGGSPRTRVRSVSNLHRLTMSVAEAPRNLTRKVSFYLGDQDSQGPTERRSRALTSFAGSALSTVAEVPGRLSRKVSFYLGDGDSQESTEGRPRSFSGVGRRIGGRPRTQSCPVAGKMGNDETEFLDLNTMD